MDFKAHFDSLFGPLVAAYGPLDENTTMAIVGFAAGGPVNLCQREASRLFVSCELSLHSDQVFSTEGCKFELLAVDDFNADQARAILTALGRMSMGVALGDNHTVDVSQVDGAGVVAVKLEHAFNDPRPDMPYCIYRCRPV